MPIYEYTCKSCHKKFEKLVKSMDSTEAAVCPACGSRKTERELSVFAVSSESSHRAPEGRPPMCEGCCGEGCPMADE